MVTLKSEISDMKTFGRTIRRLEDESLVTGRSRFVDDIPIEGVLTMAVLRSPFANASFTVDVEPARRLPGVVGAWSAGDLPDLTLNQVGVDLPPRPVLARGHAKFAGEAIAVIVAANAHAALGAIEADFEPGAVAVDVVQARAAGGPVVQQGLPSNVAYRLGPSAADVDLMAGADVVVRAHLVNQRMAPGMLEGRAVAAIPDGDHLTIYASHQMPHKLRDDLAAALGIARELVRVIVPEVGGGFGAKASVYPEDVLVSYLASTLGRPVKFVETRTENLISCVHGRGQRQSIELGATSDGDLVAFRADVDVDFGAYVDNQRYSTSLCSMMVSGAYLIPKIEATFRGVLTHTPPVGAFRGAGRPEATYMIERAMDMLANELKMDPADLRFRNFIPPDAFPYDPGTEAMYDSGNYAPTLRAALDKVDYDGWRERQTERRASGGTRHIGIGIVSYVELSAGGNEDAVVTVDDSGRVVVRTGTSPTGQGHHTTWAQLVGHELGMSPHDIEVILADTGEVATGGGTGGSRSAPMGGSAVVGAARATATTLRSLAGNHMGCAPDEIELMDGVARHIGTEDTVTLAILAKEADGEIREEYAFQSPNLSYPFGSHICVVEIDEETGEVEILRYLSVDDCGAVINPLVVEGQMHGGTLQGISQALYEEVVFDDFGGLITANLTSYPLPDITQAPDLETFRTETPTPNNDRGIKGMAEAGTTAATPAVANAVFDALAHLGVDDAMLPMPYTPEKVWRAIVVARASR